MPVKKENIELYSKLKDLGYVKERNSKTKWTKDIENYTLPFKKTIYVHDNYIYGDVISVIAGRVVTLRQAKEEYDKMSMTFNFELDRLNDEMERDLNELKAYRSNITNRINMRYDF